MDIVSAGFLVLVVFLGGFIALVADNLGRRLGKKRHTLFGLRPRHTAALITAGAGILIPFITVGVITYASEDIRTWLFEGRKAIREVSDLGKQVDDLQKVKSGLDKDIQAKTEQVQNLDKRLKNVSAQLELFKAKAANYLARAQRASLKATELQSKLASLNMEIDKQKAIVAAAKTDVKEKRAVLNKMEKESKLLDKEIRLRDEHNAALDEDNKRLEKLVASMNKDLDLLKQDKDRVFSQLDAAKNELAKTREQFSKEIDAKIAELTDTEERLKLARVQLEQNIDASRFKPLIFNFGEEIKRQPIPPLMSRADCANALSSLLRATRVVAEAKGAAADKNHLSADMWPLTTNQGSLSVESLKSQIVDTISNRGEHFVLIAYSSFNAFKGEWVRLTVKGYRNPIVYTAGHVIAEGTIDGTKTDDEVVNQIGELIHSKVTPQAAQDKMIPVSGRENGFGTVEQADLLELVKQIREANRRIKLRISAAQDTRAADELKLKFTLR